LLKSLPEAHLHYIFGKDKFRKVAIEVKTVSTVLPMPWDTPKCDWSSSILVLKESKIRKTHLGNGCWDVKIFGGEIFHLAPVNFKANTRIPTLSRLDPQTFKGFTRINKTRGCLPEVDFFAFGFGTYFENEYGNHHKIWGAVAGVPEDQDYYVDEN